MLFFFCIKYISVCRYKDVSVLGDEVSGSVELNALVDDGIHLLALVHPCRHLLAFMPDCHDLALHYADKGVAVVRLRVILGLLHDEDLGHILGDYRLADVGTEHRILFVCSVIAS